MCVNGVQLYGIGTRVLGGEFVCVVCVSCVERVMGYH